MRTIRVEGKLLPLLCESFPKNKINTHSADGKLNRITTSTSFFCSWSHYHQNSKVGYSLMFSFLLASPPMPAFSQAEMMAPTTGRPCFFFQSSSRYKRRRYKLSDFSLYSFNSATSNPRCQPICSHLSLANLATYNITTNDCSLF